MRISLNELKQIIREEIVDEAIGKDTYGNTYGSSSASSSANRPDPSRMTAFIKQNIPQGQVKAFIRNPENVRGLIKKAKGEYPQFSEEDIKQSIMTAATSPDMVRRGPPR